MCPAFRPSLSVIMCTHNGAEKLSIALDSLHRQTLEDLELIVVDDGSTDASVEVAAAYGVSVERLSSNVGLAAARNAGVARAGADLIAFTDDDCAVGPDWAEQIVTAFVENPALDGVSGPVVPQSTSPFVRSYLEANNPLAPLGAELLVSNAFLYRLGLYLRRRLMRDSQVTNTLYSVVGANMAFRRKAIESVGGFDPAFRFGSEEEDLCRRLHDRPGPTELRYLPDLTVTHWFTPSVTDSVRRARAYGRGNARMVLKHPSMRLIVFPAPVLLGAGILSAVAYRRPRWLALAMLSPWALYPSWLRTRSRGPGTLSFPLLSLAQEIATMVGEAEGLRAGNGAEPTTPSR